MIYSRLHGGLGNQLFQYAAGRALAIRLKTDLCIDDRILSEIGLRPCHQHFNWKIEDCQELPPKKSDGLLKYGIWRVFGQTPRLRRERELTYNRAFERWPDETYLHGYWQSEKYFLPIEDVIRNDLKITTPASAQNTEMAAQIAKKMSVSLHVRRGDYLALAAHNICTKAYYHAALAKVAETANISPQVFVFSDDPEWAKEHLPLPYEKTVVDFNGPEADFEDLRLMSLCQHNVIANSSFSWWGAWLNRNPNKVVAGPAQWFGDAKLSNSEILPPAWLRIAMR